MRCYTKCVLRLCTQRLAQLERLQVFGRATTAGLTDPVAKPLDEQNAVTIATTIDDVAINKIFANSVHLAAAPSQLHAGQREDNNNLNTNTMEAKHYLTKVEIALQRALTTPIACRQPVYFGNKEQKKERKKERTPT